MPKNELLVEMVKGIMELCVRKIIDAQSASAWDRHVFEDTYKEFYMQAQQFDPESNYQSFREMFTHIPQTDRMHYLVSTAAINYIRQLNDIIPDVANVFGKNIVPFKKFRFEILDSHREKKEKHQVAIYFHSEPLIWIDTLAQGLLISTEKAEKAFSEGYSIPTEIIPITPNVSIASFQKFGIF